MSTHEAFVEFHRTKRSSDRSFGVVMAVCFAAVGVLPAWRGHPVRWWAVAVALVFVVVATIRPAALARLNVLWTRLGLALGRIVTPVVISVVFFVAVAPTAVIRRLFGRDSLRRRFDPSAATYWIPRTPPGPDPETMRRQF